MSLCAINDPRLLMPLVQDGQPIGRTYDGRFVQALRCPHCAYVRFPAPSEAELDRYYAVDYPAASASWYNVEIDYSPWKTTSRADRIERLIHAFGISKGAVLHEFGCAFGGTVHELATRGYRASGTELNQGAVAAGRSRGNPFIHAEGAVEYLSRTGQSPDAVYAWHAIEHFTKPLDFLKQLRDLIRPGGLLILIVPSAAARFPLVYGLNRYIWFGYPEHVHLFTPGCAPSMAAEVGMKLVHVASAEYGIEPEATGRALQVDSDAARWIRLAEPQLLGEELIIVLRRDNGTDTALADVERRETLRCDTSAAIERRVMEALQAGTVDPWAPRAES
jgi:SAM-dependent methyltransferase